MLASFGLNFSTISERQVLLLLVCNAELYRIEHTDCFDWLRGCAPQNIHAVCTDPPYGLIEFGKPRKKLCLTC